MFGYLGGMATYKTCAGYVLDESKVEIVKNSLRIIIRIYLLFLIYLKEY